MEVAPRGRSDMQNVDVHILRRNVIKDLMNLADVTLDMSLNPFEILRVLGTNSLITGNPIVVKDFVLREPIILHCHGLKHFITLLADFAP